MSMSSTPSSTPLRSTRIFAGNFGTGGGSDRQRRRRRRRGAAVGGRRRRRSPAAAAARASRVAVAAGRELRRLVRRQVGRGRGDLRGPRRAPTSAAERRRPGARRDGRAPRNVSPSPCRSGRTPRSRRARCRIAAAGRRVDRAGRSRSCAVGLRRRQLPGSSAGRWRRCRRRRRRWPSARRQRVDRRALAVSRRRGRRSRCRSYRRRSRDRRGRHAVGRVVRDEVPSARRRPADVAAPFERSSSPPSPLGRADTPSAADADPVALDRRVGRADVHEDPVEPVAGDDVPHRLAVVPPIRAPVPPRRLMPSSLSLGRGGRAGAVEAERVALDDQAVGARLDAAAVCCRRSCCRPDLDVVGAARDLDAGVAGDDRRRRASARCRCGCPR